MSVPIQPRGGARSLAAARRFAKPAWPAPATWPRATASRSRNARRERAGTQRSLRRHDTGSRGSARAGDGLFVPGRPGIGAGRPAHAGHRPRLAASCTGSGAAARSRRGSARNRARPTAASRRAPRWLVRCPRGGEPAGPRRRSLRCASGARRNRHGNRSHRNLAPPSSHVRAGSDHTPAAPIFVRRLPWHAAKRAGGRCASAGAPRRAGAARCALPGRGAHFPCTRTFQPPACARPGGRSRARCGARRAPRAGS